MLTASMGPSEASRLSRVTSAPASGAGDSGVADGDYISRRATAAMRARELMAIRAESGRLHSRSGSDALGAGMLGPVADASPRRHSATATLVAGRSAHAAATAAGGLAGGRKPRPLGASQKNAARYVLASIVTLRRHFGSKRCFLGSSMLGPVAGGTKAAALHLLAA